MSIPPERLAAYADGQLSPDEAREVEQAINRDPALGRTVDAHRSLCDRLGAHFAPVLSDPVPDRLTGLLGPAEQGCVKVIDFAAEARKRSGTAVTRSWTRYAGPALAATLVLGVIGLGLSWQSGRPGGDYAVGETASALDSQLVASQPADAKVHVLLSFRDPAGAVCRAYVTTGQSGIACHDTGGWRMMKRFGAGAGETGEYRQAGSPDAAVMRAAQDMARDGALDAQAEAEAQRQGWGGCCKGQLSGGIRKL